MHYTSMVRRVGLVTLLATFVAGIALLPHLAHAAATPRLYVVARAADKTYQVNYLQNMQLQGTWTPLGTLQFDSAPMVVDNLATVATHPSIKPMLWIVGIATNDRKTYMLAWQLDGTGPLNWVQVASPCQFNVGDMHFGVTYVQDTVFLSCISANPEDTSPTIGYGDSIGSDYVYINAYNTLYGSWGGWQRIGGYTGSGRHWSCCTQVTLANDGTNVLVLSTTTFSDVDLNTIWYATYPFGGSTMGAWRPYQSTGVPGAQYAADEHRYILSSLAENSAQQALSLWSAGLQPATEPSLSPVGVWYNLGTIPGNFASLSVSTPIDGTTQPHAQYFAAISTSGALYVMRSGRIEDATQRTGWIKQPAAAQTFTSLAIDLIAA